MARGAAVAFVAGTGRESASVAEVLRAAGGLATKAAAALNSAGTAAPLAISSLTRTQAARYISSMQQTEYSIWDFTVEDFILQGRFPYTKHGIYSKHDKALVETVIDELCLNKLKGRNVHSLSGGEMQKVKIARALAQEPLFILLDEPSANLDVVFEPRLLQLLKDLAKKKNIGILMSIHDINIISDVADYVWLLPPARPESAPSTGSTAPTPGSKTPATVSPAPVPGSSALVGSPTPGLITGTYQEVMTLENLKTTFGEDFQWIEKKYFQLLQ